VNALEEKKGENILLLDLHEIADFTDYFIICSGTSDRMLDALAQAVSDEARNKFKIHSKIEGVGSDGWLVVDLGDIVVHMFSQDQRTYYQLEQLWERAKTLVHLQ
jgi:ribosome-associated protein